MSDVERDFIKAVDKKILTASEKTLKKLQKLDTQTQLKELTFYDAYANSKSSGKKQTHSTKPRVVRKSKRK